jgi:DNA polymerase, archaea type
MYENKELIQYYHNKKNQVMLKFRDVATNAIEYDTVDYPSFFFIKNEDVNKVKEVLSQFIYVNEKTNFSIRVDFEYKQESDKYTKVTYSNTHDLYLYEFTKQLSKALDDKFIIHFEADLQPGDNIVLNNDLQISDKYRILYFDIETKDTEGGVEIGRDRILSICGIDNRGYEYVLCDDDEEIILQKFVKILACYDIITGWNSDNFDLPYIKARLAYYKMYISLKDIIHIDLMTVFMASFAVKTRIGKKYITSYSLDNIARNFINDSKLEIAEFGSGYGGRIWNMFVNNREKLIAYNMQDCKLLKRLDEEFHLIQNEIEVARLIGVPLSKTRNMNSMIDFLVVKAARKKGMHFYSKKYGAEKATYAGGYCYEGKHGFYTDVYIFDFASLYPSIFRTFNISADTYLKEEIHGCIKTPNGVCFKQERGLIPEILDKLTDLRLKLKNEQKLLENDGKKQEALLLEFRQTAVKVVILSVYGIMGSAFSRFFNLNVAESITLTGQHLLKSIIDVLNNNCYNVVGGDTDSIFFQLHDPNKKQVVEKLIADTIEQEVRKCGVTGKNYLRMEHEKILSKFIVLAKKKYVGLVNDAKGDYLYWKGIELQKGSEILITKELLQDVITAILIQSKNASEVESILKRYRNDILNRKIGDINKIVIIKKVGRMPETYKNLPKHVELALARKEKGEHFYTSMRVPFIVINGKEMEIIHKDDYTGVYDEKYYWTKCIFPPTYRLLSVVFPDFNWDKYNSSDKFLQEKLFVMEKNK